MKLSEEKLANLCQEVDLDPQCHLQYKIQNQICAKKYSFKRKTVWACSAVLMAVSAVLFWWPRTSSPYLPDPAEFNRKNFAFYRDLALPGQDLGISYADFTQTVQ